MAAQEYRRRAWVMSAFALTREDPEAWKKEPYAYRIVQMTTGFSFVDPANENQLTRIEDAKPGEPLFKFLEKIVLKKGATPNVDRDLETTYGNVLLNCIVLVYPFGDKVPFVTGRINPTQLEKIILPRIKDTPPEGAVRDPKWLYTDEYLKFADAAFSLAGFNQLCVPAATEKTMQAAPGIHEYRAKLIEENKDRLHDQAVIAYIDAKLVEYDKAYLKGDASEGFLISKKSTEIVRKKQYGMHGAEVGLTESVDVDLIQNSLSEGWDINKFPAMNNSLRAGSFNRGKQTELGGASAKEIARASSNLAVTDKDCGSQLGYSMDIDGQNYKELIGFWLVGGKEPIHVPDEEAAKKYVGKTVARRTPLFCQLKNTDYCACCVGDTLAANPTALPVAVSEIGSAFLYIFMSAAHAKKLAVTKLNWKRRIT